MRKKGKCKYCGKTIDNACIRCYICNDAWQEGYIAGSNSERDKAYEHIKYFVKLKKKLMQKGG